MTFVPGHQSGGVQCGIYAPRADIPLLAGTARTGGSAQSRPVSASIPAPVEGKRPYSEVEMGTGGATGWLAAPPAGAGASAVRSGCSIINAAATAATAAATAAM